MADQKNNVSKSVLSFPTSLPDGYVETRPTGLTSAEAEKRLACGMGNTSAADRGKSFLQILKENTFSLFNLVNFVLAACLFAVGSYRNMLFLGVVISNILIGVIQEMRAQSTIRRLQVLNAPTNHVLRDGKKVVCKAEQLVVGDLIVLYAGDQIPADAMTISGHGAVNEALLTGESDPVQKQPGDWLMSGSYVTEGEFTAQLVYVGAESYAGRLTRDAKRIKRPKSMLMTDLDKLIRLVSIILIPLGAALFIKQYFLLHEPLKAAVTTSAAAMLGMIPEGLILLTSVALAVGVIKLSKRRTLVQELYGIETLARVDTICLDKTGTITSGSMTLTNLLPIDCTEEVLRTSLSRFLGAFSGTSATLDALRNAIVPADEPPTALLHFSSARKKSAATFADGKTLVLGAPNFVLNEGMLRGETREKIIELTTRGMRVMVLAEADCAIENDDIPFISRVLGIIGLSDEIRANAEKTLQYFYDEGVTIKIISGDDPKTVSAIAKLVGLEGYGNAVDAGTLQTDADIADACERYTVFGRVTPARKRQLVEAMKAHGHCVAMTGDGVNDIPAMKSADCSIAMAGGSDAAKHAAQLTLLNADFASLPAIVLEGRRVVNNVMRSACLFLTKTLFSFGLSVLLLLLPGAYPFQPIHLTLISALTIGAPSFVLALEPSRERIQGRFLRTVLRRAIPGAAAVTICSTLAMLSARWFGFPTEVCTTMAVISAGLVGFCVLIRTARPFNRLRIALLAAMIIAFIGAVVFFGNVFMLVPLRLAHLPVLIGLMALGAAITFLLPLLLPK